MKKEDKQIDLNELIAEARETYNDLILYDGICNLCHSWKNLIQKHDTKNRHRFVPLQKIVTSHYDHKML